ncbi:hypothetical protein [Niveibacterium terrae]|uniref:hypothetical protein n=1 Tax=Niveibacterium terrae TaxID=3373598 RepID=UPI003A8FB631
MSNETDTPKSRIERNIAIGKDLISLLRDSSLFGLALLLLFFPKTLNTVLTSAGFDEGSIVGFKWKARLVETDDALKSAKTTIETLQAQLIQANDALANVAAAVPSGDLKQKTQLVEKAGRNVLAAAEGATDAARSTIAANANLVERAQMTIPSPGGWAVIFGSDKSRQAAQDEIARAAKIGIRDARIYLRNGYFASIAVVPTREEAAEYLLIAKTFRSDAYTTRFTTWCISPTQRDGYIECAPTK